MKTESTQQTTQATPKMITVALVLTLVTFYLPTAHAGESDDILSFIDSFEPIVKKIPEGFYLESTRDRVPIKEYTGTIGRFNVDFYILNGKVLSFHLDYKRGYNVSAIQNDFQILKKVFDHLITKHNLQDHVKIEDQPSKVEKFERYGKTAFSHGKQLYANAGYKTPLAINVRFSLGYRQYWKGELSNEGGSYTGLTINYEKRSIALQEEWRKKHGG